MDIALTILALLAGGLTLELFAVARAPLGYQDKAGFHFGTPNNPGPQMNSLDIRTASIVKAAAAPGADVCAEASMRVEEDMPVEEGMPVEAASRA